MPMTTEMGLTRRTALATVLTPFSRAFYRAGPADETQHRLHPDGQSRLRRGRLYGGGILRGAPTPRIDKLASEGTRLTNFNVEAQCTPSRSAIMTGRFSIRSGHALGADRRRARRTDAVGSDPRRVALRRRLRHRPLRQVAPGQRPGTAAERLRASTSGTASRAPPTRPSGRRNLQPRKRASSSMHIMEGRKGEKSRELASCTTWNSAA